MELLTTVTVISVNGRRLDSRHEMQSQVIHDFLPLCKTVNVHESVVRLRPVSVAAKLHEWIHSWLLAPKRLPMCSSRRQITGRMAIIGWSGQCPSLEEGLSECPSLMLADDFFCFCLDFLSIRTYKQQKTTEV